MNERLKKNTNENDNFTILVFYEVIEASKEL